jgi:hypothetical protein
MSEAPSSPRQNCLVHSLGARVTPSYKIQLGIALVKAMLWDGFLYCIMMDIDMSPLSMSNLHGKQTSQLS